MTARPTRSGARSTRRTDALASESRATFRPAGPTRRSVRHSGRPRNVGTAMGAWFCTANAVPRGSRLGSTATPAADATPELAHSSTVFLIDPAGRLRVVLGAEASPRDIAHDVRAVLRSSE